MKRILVTILSILYMASAMGATVEIHYCMGKMMGANFVHKQDDKCRKCGMHKSKTNGCCKDEHKTFKTSDHHQIKGSIDIAQVEAIAPPVLIYHYPAPDFYVASAVYAARPHAPPDLYSGCALFLQIRNIRV